MDWRKYAVAAAKEYRLFWEENRKLRMALGFVPVVGQVLGAADAVAATLDPDADKLETALAYAGMIPAGKILQAGKQFKLTLGRKGAQRLKDAGLGDEIISEGEWRGQYIAEIQDDLAGTGKRLHATSQGPRIASLGEMTPDDMVAHTAYPELANLNVVANPSDARTRGSFHGTDGRIELDVPDNANLASFATRTLRHETQHAAQALENRPSEFRGANMSIGRTRYYTQPGEIMARVDSIRSNWTPEQRRMLPLTKHLEAEEARVGHALATGRHENIWNSAAATAQPEDILRNMEDIGDPSIYIDFVRGVGDK